ncbi:OmpA family protein [Methylibium sp.]|uniref:OmpA family protein n=1 Tax=Methylibium sp. TaxID=2067992 RepID=UPI0018010441|nr:OmpA family protein [Methylibium sp.]MBA3588730.1 OmpA family protein [Methylibium sp.]
MKRCWTRVATTTRAALGVALIGSALTGCASRSYVALLANDDGTVGKVHVLGKDGGTIYLDKDREAAVIGAAAGRTFAIDDERLAKDFASAMAASPQAPTGFLLYFESGGAKLTAESNAIIPRVLDAVHARQAADISVIGHTDTVGDVARNDTLGRERAGHVARLIREHAKSQRLRIAVESHGENNLLVTTPDNTEDSRNRRVEVTVR